MEKINVAELLKDCPKGMELDCTMFDDVKFIAVDEAEKPLCIRTGEIYRFLTEFGTWTFDENAKCVIFPKGKTTWEGFQRPFVDGDILSYQCAGLRNRTIYIYRHHSTMNTSFYVALGGNLDFMVNSKDWVALNCYNDTVRLATVEENEKLFNAIKDNGYKWNPDTKTLEKLIEPKFKVGDKVRHKNNHNVVFTITNIEEDTYVCGAYKAFWFDDQDEYELVPNKFDINTLKPFDKVLVRDFDNTPWEIELFSRLLDGKHFKCLELSYVQCIHYEGNEHLLGKKDNCHEYFKNWK